MRGGRRVEAEVLARRYAHGATTSGAIESARRCCRWSTLRGARAWELVKDGRILRCDLVRHPHGLELRLWEGDDLRRTELFRDQDAMLEAVDAWRVSAEAKGWGA